MKIKLVKLSTQNKWGGNNKTTMSFIGHFPFPDFYCGLLFRWICEINPTDLEIFPSGVSGSGLFTYTGVSAAHVCGYREGSPLLAVFASFPISHINLPSHL